MLVHKITIDESYLVYSVYGEDPAKFVITRGGFYEESSGEIYIQLEFNSQFETDGVKEMTLSYRQLANDQWTFGKEGLEYSRTDEINQELDGLWLFATRGPDTGQERRDDFKCTQNFKNVRKRQFSMDRL